MQSRQRKPKILPQFNYVHDQRVIDEFGLDSLKGQGSIVLSVLQYTPMPTDSRVIGNIVGNHPEFKTKMTPSDLEAKYRVTNYWLCYFKRVGLIKYHDESRQSKYDERAVTAKLSNYTHRKS